MSLLKMMKKGLIIGTVIAIIIIIVLIFYLLSPSLSPIASIRDTDGDDHPDSSDAFPTISTQWSDIDHDGFGDNPNGITPDKFPTDPTQWFDFDQDGYGDNPSGTTPDAFPADPTQWSDIDHDGYGDNPNGTNSDAFPTNPLEWKDTDHDGHGDNSDVAPSDPLIWASGSATIIVTVYSHHMWYPIDYILYLNGVQKATGSLAAGSSVTHTITVDFLYGVNNYTTVTVLATSTGGGWGATSDTVSLNIVNGQTYPVTLSI
jgi:hypothetical protein